jgi:hypothetical protein
MVVMKCMLLVLCGMGLAMYANYLGNKLLRLLLSCCLSFMPYV